MGTFFHRHRGLVPYLLLAPGLAWLALFFLVPLGFLGYQSLQSGIFPNLEFTWEFSNFTDALSDYREQFLRSFLYAGIATVLSLLIAYPLVYWIAFRAGPWKNLFLLFIVAPFFVTYLIRTLAWLNILADEGLRVVQALPQGVEAAQESFLVDSVQYEQTGLPLSLRWRAGRAARAILATDSTAPPEIVQLVGTGEPDSKEALGVRFVLDAGTSRKKKPDGIEEEA